MAFPDIVVERAWSRSGGVCECRRSSHLHIRGRCSNKLAWDNRGRESHGAWEAHHVDSTGADTQSNCEILCWDCHKTHKTLTNMNKE